MPFLNSSTLRQKFISSRQLLPGDWANAVTESQSSTQIVTASTTQTQAGGAVINSAAVAVTTGNANDAITLPKGAPGLEIFISNLSAVALGVFPAVGDTIFPSLQNAVLAQAASKTALYKCIQVNPSTGNATWYKLASA